MTPEKTASGKTYEEIGLSWRSILVFDVFLLASLVLATRLATFLHEFMGHALLATAFGGHVGGIYVSLFGGGNVCYDLQANTVLFARFLVAFGGILVNIASGLLSLCFVPKLVRRPEWALFVVLFAMASLLGAIAYCALGFYYQEGDPVAWIEGPVPCGQWAWIIFLVISPFVSYLTVRAYSILNEQFFPGRTFVRRVAMTLLTLGVTGAAYAGLYGLTDQHLVALDAASLAHERAEHEVRKKKTEDLVAGLRKAHPELGETELQRLVEQIRVIVEPDEVPERFPLQPVIVVLYIGGALLGVYRVRKGVSEPLVQITPRSTVLAVTLAGALLGVLVWTGGWVYR